VSVIRSSEVILQASEYHEADLRRAMSRHDGREFARSLQAAPVSIEAHVCCLHACRREWSRTTGCSCVEAFSGDAYVKISDGPSRGGSKQRGREVPAQAAAIRNTRRTTTRRCLIALLLVSSFSASALAWGLERTPRRADHRHIESTHKHHRPPSRSISGRLRKHWTRATPLPTEYWDPCNTPSRLHRLLPAIMVLRQKRERTDLRCCEIMLELREAARAAIRRRTCNEDQRHSQRTQPTRIPINSGPSQEAAPHGSVAYADTLWA